MHHHMQIVPDGDLLGGFVALQHVPGVVEDVFAVGQKGVVLDFVVSKLAQRHIQKPQINQKRIAGQDQHLPGKVI